jgi:hypothetical protein
MSNLLHELLAVEADLRNTKDKAKDTAVRDFTVNPGRFLGAVKTLKLFDESRGNEEGEARAEVEDTVIERLQVVAKHFAKYWDLRLQKESANQMAVADVEVDGKYLFTDVPVTFLLNMEEELRQVRKVYENTPTLKPGVSWVPDEIKGRGIYKSEFSEEKSKTEKSIQHKVLTKPTEFHPAQIEKWSEDKVIGKYITENWSGMITPADKAIYLSNIDKLLRAFKKARQRANCRNTDPMEIGKKIFDYIGAK